MYGLGRKPFVEDMRDWNVEKVEALIADGSAVPLEWSVPRILDQGDNGTCVSAGILGACDCDDETHTDSKFTSDDIVPFFLKISGHGQLPDGGAEVREGLKAAKAAGYIYAYSLLKTVAEIKSWLEKHGPVVIGTDWFSDMDTPDGSGKVTVGGYVRGGHCIYGNGDVDGMDFVNSWGDRWGFYGGFFVTPSDFAKLMNGDFEAWAVVQPVKPVPTPTPSPTPPTPPSGCLTWLLSLVDWFKANQKG
jgi:hypothetical protein